MDGKVIIGTTLDDKEFDKKLDALQKKEIKKQVEIDIQTTNVENARQKLQDLEKDLRDYENKMSEISAKAEKFAEYEQKYPNLTDDERMEYAALAIENIPAKEQEALEILQKKTQEYEKANQELQNEEAKLERIRDVHSDIVEKIKQRNEEIKKARLEDIKNQIGDVGKSIEKVTKKVGRWALAVFSVRSAYMFIRQSISVLSETNEKLAADIQTIRYALASALEPIILRIVDLVYKLLGYLGYIIKAWTGKNIFANANKGLKAANKEAKELKKQLASFDEMNILQDNKQKASVTPSGDISKLPDKVPGWVDFIAGNGRELLAIILGIVAGITALKLGLKGIKALGIGVVVAGLVYTIKSILDYIKDPSWSNFGDILIGISVILAGLAILIGGWPLLLAAAIVLMLGIIAKFWDKIKEFLTNIKSNITKLGEDIRQWLHDHLGILGDIIGAAIQGFLGIFTGAIDTVITLFDGLFGGIKEIIDGIVAIFKEGIGVGLVKIFKGAVNVMIGLINFLIDGLNTVLAPIRALVMVIGNIMGNDWTMDDVKIPHIPKLARGGIIHNPGKGVLMGSYIVGEGASPEAVLPLDDNTLDRLGEKIAKHMTINANITNTMNGRVISRELHKINNESAFAYNG